MNVVYTQRTVEVSQK